MEMASYQMRSGSAWNERCELAGGGGGCARLVPERRPARPLDNALRAEVQGR